jgi:hypothetical protein
MSASTAAGMAWKRAMVQWRADHDKTQALWWQQEEVQGQLRRALKIELAALRRLRKAEARIEELRQTKVTP